MGGLTCAVLQGDVTDPGQGSWAEDYHTEQWGVPGALAWESRGHSATLRFTVARLLWPGEVALKMCTRLPALSGWKICWGCVLNPKTQATAALL